MDLLEIAHHEAAHAVFHLKLGIRQGRVTIKPDERRGTLGHAELRRPKWINEQPARPREELRLRILAESEILALYAGRISQGKYTGSEIDWGHESDDHQAMELASSFVSDDDEIRYAFLVYCQKQCGALLAGLDLNRWCHEFAAMLAPPPVAQPNGAPSVTRSKWMDF
jgi:hypothetical protein